MHPQQTYAQILLEQAKAELAQQPPQPSPFESMSDYEAGYTRAIAEEVLARRSEALALYRPSPFQERFHACQAKQCLLQKGQQTGGSIALFAELARAVTGQDPHGKYPQKDGIAVVLGMSIDHIGINIHPYLFQSARFKIIRDEVTDEWRTFRPWEEADAARKLEAVDAPPLIPERFIKHIAWISRGENQFSYVEFTTGWKLHAMGSQGVPKAGFQADLVCIDEDLEKPNWYQEMMARLLMRSGKLRWAALPYGHNDAILNLIEMAEDQEGDPEPDVVAVRATIWDNPYMPKKDRDDTIKAWKKESEEVYQMRAFGKVTLGHLMYPTFHKDVHGIPRREGLGPIHDVLIAQNGQPPLDWCRYMIVDPGHTICAVVFFAVPPPDLGDYVVAYKELYIPDCDAVKFGRRVSAVASNEQFEAFLIDMHGARLRDIGGGEQPIVQYSRHLELHGIKSNATGHNFWPGVDKEASRSAALREWLTIREDGTVKFQVLHALCPNLVMNFQRYKRKVIDGVVRDEPNTRTPNHATACAEYAAGHGLKYVRPRALVVKPTNAAEQIKALRAQMDKLLGQSGQKRNFVNLGPTGE